MRLVVGRVQIDGDTPHPPVQTTPMPLDDARRQLAPHPVERGAARAVLEPRDRRLRRQGRAGHLIDSGWRPNGNLDRWPKAAIEVALGIRLAREGEKVASGHP